MSKQCKKLKDNKIHIRAEFIIGKGKIREFRRLIQEMSNMVESNEPDTLEYRFYLNYDETKCIVHETYVNSNAALSHNSGIASQTILPKIFSISKLNRLDVYGKPNKELQGILKNFNFEHYILTTGFSQ